MVPHQHWSGRHLSEMEEVQVISGQDMIRPDAPSRESVFTKKEKNGIENIASPMWHWGKFYEQIVQNVLDGTWKKTKTAMNYWLGLSSDVIDIVYSNNLPVGTRRLLKFLEAPSSKALWSLSTAFSIPRTASCRNLRMKA